VRDSLALTLILSVAALVGFANQLVIARAFGAGLSMDLYLQAVAIPLFVMGTVGGLFAYAMVPVLTRTRADGERGKAVAGRFLQAFGALALMLAIAGWFLAPLQLRLLGANRLSSQSVSAATTIARIAWGAASLSVLTGFLSSVGNAARKFLVPGLAALLPILGVLVACLGWARSFGVEVLAVGMLAGFLCAAFALFSAVRHELAWPVARTGARDVTAFLRASPLALVSVLSFAVYPAVDAFWAPRLGISNLSYLGYCQRLLVAAGTIMIVGPATVLQTRLAEAAHQGRHDELRRDLTSALRLTVTIAAPAAMLVSLLRGPVIGLLFERGAFDAVATQRVAALLVWMLPGMVAMLCMVILYKALFARGDLRAGMILGVVGPAAYFGLSGLLSGLFGVNGIGAAYSVTWIAVAALGVGMVFWARDRGWHRPRQSTVMFTGKLAGAMAISGAVTWGTAQGVLSQAGSMGTMELGLRVAIVAALGASTYLAIALYAGCVPELSALISALYRRRAVAVK
jgi:putative peptidoglycan lipid II flippase